MMNSRAKLDIGGPVTLSQRTKKRPRSRADVEDNHADLADLSCSLESGTSRFHLTVCSGPCRGRAQFTNALAPDTTDAQGPVGTVDDRRRSSAESRIGRWTRIRQGKFTARDDESAHSVAIVRLRYTSPGREQPSVPRRPVRPLARRDAVRIQTDDRGAWVSAGGTVTRGSGDR